MQKDEKSEASNSAEHLFKYALVDAGISFAVIIALPLVAFIYAGKWLDQKYNHHFFVLIGILVALFVSSLGVYRKILEIQKLIKSKQDRSQKPPQSI